MTTLESVALDQERWWSTALGVKSSNHARFTVMIELTIAGAFLEALALQLHTSYPVASQIAGYAGAVALALVVIIRARGLRSERLQAWVVAAAAAHALKSEMYKYRTSCNPYAGHASASPEDTLLQRRDDIAAKLSSIRQYIVEPEPKTATALGPLDADAYISERINGEIDKFRQFTRNLSSIQSRWLKREYFLLIGGILLAAILTFTHNQVYGAWVAVIAILSLASGVTAKAERYATLIVECRAMPDHLTSILEGWRLNHGTLEQLVEQVEGLVLAQAQAWVVGVADFPNIAASRITEFEPRAALHFPASQAKA